MATVWTSAFADIREPDRLGCYMLSASSRTAMKIAGRVEIATVTDVVCDACGSHTSLIASGQNEHKEKAIEQEKAHEAVSCAGHKAAPTGGNAIGHGRAAEDV